MIVVLDHGLGNIGSVVNMVKRVGGQVVASADPGVIATADRLILPGVGRFDVGMGQLERLGLLDVLHTAVLVRKIPILGICLGMQLFTERSEEGERPGLGWIAGETVRFDGIRLGGLRVPHMGWNEVVPRRSTPLFVQLGGETRFYFLHSYHVTCRDDSDVLATARYGYDFVSALQRGNIVGVQFHPEKSHRFGMEIMKVFVQGDCFV